MKNLNRIGIALDLSNQDANTLSFTGYLSRAVQPEILIGMHVVPVWEIGDFLKIDIKHPLQPAAPALGKLHEMLSAELENFTWYPQSDLKVAIEQGRPHQKIQDIANEEEIDLLVVGQKFVSSGSGITTKRLVRHIKCDLLFVPNLDRFQIERILVAIDFSKHSYEALRKAMELAASLELEEPVVALYDINLLPFLLYGKFGNEDTVHDDLISAAQERYEDFVKKYELNKEDFDFQIKTGNGKNVSEDILTYAQEMNADLVMMGAVGHRALENYLLGSVTESLLHQNQHFPIWVVRN